MAQEELLASRPAEPGLIASTGAKVIAQPRSAVRQGREVAIEPGGRLIVEFATPVRVARVRLVSGAFNPITAFRLKARDAGGAVTTLVQATVRSPEVFLPQEYRFPPFEARELRLEVDQTQAVRLAPGGGIIKLFEAYEK